jgi:hypothetical protein
MSAENRSPKAPRFARTLKFSVRAWWDSLGLACAASITLFTAFSLPASILVSGLQAHNSRSVGAVCLSIVLLTMVVFPLYGGLCWIAHKVLTRDEPGYTDMWNGARAMYLRSAGLGLLQLVVTAILVSNIVFYLLRGTLAFLLLAILFMYGLIYWGMNCLYHWPLLIANEAGIVRREDGEKPGMLSVLRNGFLMASSAPGYTLLLTALLAITLALLAVSGLGLALLSGGVAAYLSTQATRDQLIRFGVLPTEPDPDEEVVEEAWKVR